MAAQLTLMRCDGAGSKSTCGESGKPPVCMLGRALIPKVSAA